MEKQFPAPNRRFVYGKGSKRTKLSKTKSAALVKDRSSSSTRKSTDSDIGRTRNARKKARVVYSDDSDESDCENEMNVDSDDDDFKGEFLHLLNL